MRKLLLVVGSLIIWGLVIIVYVSMIDVGNTNYQKHMQNNYLVNSYEGRVLLSQDEYTEFTKSLLDDNVEINQLDVYESDTVLVIYDIKSPSDNVIPFVGEPKSQDWYYEIGREWDYIGYGLTSILMITGALFLNIVLLGCLGYLDD